MFYNLTITVLSAFVALVVGIIVLFELLVDKLWIESGPAAAIGSLELENVGYIKVGLFVITWLIALCLEIWTDRTALEPTGHPLRILPTGPDKTEENRS